MLTKLSTLCILAMGISHSGFAQIKIPVQNQVQQNPTQQVPSSPSIKLTYGKPVKEQYKAVSFQEALAQSQAEPQTYENIESSLKGALLDKVVTVTTIDRSGCQQGDLKCLEEASAACLAEFNKLYPQRAQGYSGSIEPLLRLVQKSNIDCDYVDAGKAQRDAHLASSMDSQCRTKDPYKYTTYMTLSDYDCNNNFKITGEVVTLVTDEYEVVSTHSLSNIDELGTFKRNDRDNKAALALGFKYMGSFNVSNKYVDEIYANLRTSLVYTKDDKEQADWGADVDVETGIVLNSVKHKNFDVKINFADLNVDYRGEGEHTIDFSAFDLGFVYNAIDGKLEVYLEAEPIALQAFDKSLLLNLDQESPVTGKVQEGMISTFSIGAGGGFKLTLGDFSASAHSEFNVGNVTGGINKHSFDYLDAFETKFEKTFTTDTEVRLGYKIMDGKMELFVGANVSSMNAQYTIDGQKFSPAVTSIRGNAGFTWNIGKTKKIK